MARHASHARHTPPYHFGVPMSERQLSRSRKRERSELLKPRGSPQPVPKKQRLDHGRPGSLGAFWDSLSVVHLTKRALQELDRRNSLTATKEPCQTAHYTNDYHRGWGLPKVSKNIEQFARRGGPDLSGLKNYPEPSPAFNHTTSSSQSNYQSRQRGSAITSIIEPTTNPLNSKSTGPYDPNFQQKLIDNAVYPHGYRRPDGVVPAEPMNWKDFNQILALPRPSLSLSRFTDEDYKKFVQKDADAAKEKQVSESVIPIVEGMIADTKCRSGGISFTNLVDLVNSDPLADPTLTPGNPDIYYGARPEQLNLTVRKDLSLQIIPTKQDNLPIAPNFFLEVKGPDGSLAVATRQACYDGALGARGMHALQSYQQATPVYDNASTISSIYHGGQLKIYTSHLAPPRIPGGRPETYMTQVNTWGMTGNAETFRQGAAAYRNARDWAKEQRDTAISRVNERFNRAETEAPADDAGAGLVPSFVTAVSETEAYTVSKQSLTSVNEDSQMQMDSDESESSVEDAVEYKLPAKRSGSQSKHLQTPQKRRNTNSTSQGSGAWRRTNGKFRFTEGQELVKEQNET